MATPRIVVLDGHTLNPGDNPWHGLEKISQLTVYPRTSPAEFLDRAKDADILLTNKTPIKREQLDQLPKLKFIAVLATGYNVVDIAAAREKGISVSNVPSYGTDSVAQHVIALMMELFNQVGEHAQSVRAGDWSRCQDFSYWKRSVREISGLSLGIVGFGRIGQRVARIGHAMGMNVLAATRSLKTDGTYPVRQLGVEDLFAEADVISLHCSQTAENFQFVNRALIERMKPTAFLINTARGTLINEADLAQALHEHRIAGAALDVVSVEPPDSNNPLFGAPNCLITPHMAWCSLSARQRLMQTTVENVQAFIQGAPINCVD